MGKRSIQQLRAAHPDRVPVICKKQGESAELKMLVKKEMTVAQLNMVIRDKNTLKPHQGIFMFTGNTLLPVNHTLGEVFAQHADADGTLKFTWAKEGVFG